MHRYCIIIGDILKVIVGFRVNLSEYKNLNESSYVSI
jgi:hypothetical protein